MSGPADRGAALLFAVFPAQFPYSVFSYKVYQLAIPKYSTRCFRGNWVIGVRIDGFTFFLLLKH